MNPPPPSDELFTRAEAQRGLPEKRASLLLFLIECEVMQHVIRFQSIVALAGSVPEIGGWSAYFVSDDLIGKPVTADLRDPIGALKLARQGRGHPTIWEIERFAPDWGAGVVASPHLRAATARLMAQKYHFTARMVPGIRRNLGLDTEAVQAAFQALYGVPLATIYAPQVSLTDQLTRLGAKIANALTGVGRALRGRRT